MNIRIFWREFLKLTVILTLSPGNFTAILKIGKCVESITHLGAVRIFFLSFPRMGSRRRKQQKCHSSKMWHF